MKYGWQDYALIAGIVACFALFVYGWVTLLLEMGWI